ncbi:MAG: HEAT repeat domain-containing protein [Planctomycetota bacterium]|nr:HEAT repeat domain-containing protein [Planctomycetota bacterium]
MRLALLLCLLPFAPSVLAADDDERPDDRPEIETLLETLEDRVGKSARDDPKDREAVQLIESLAGQYESSGDNDRGDIVRGLDRVFLAKRRADRDGKRETGLFIAAAKALGKTGDDGAKRLLRWIGNPKHRQDVALQRELVLALGATRSDDAVKPLADLLGEDVPQIVGAAAAALGNFDGKDQKVRKSLFEDLLKKMESYRENARGNDSTAQALWGALRGPGNQSLGKLSGARQNDPESWRRWWNKNKRLDWDA